MIKLWSINRWLRYTGFRLAVDVSTPDDPDDYPTRVGFIWVGFPGSKGWRRWEPTVEDHQAT